MPELPEVEIARRNLQRWLVGTTLTTAEFTDRKILAEEPAVVSATLLGQRVTRVCRRGKWLRIELGERLRLFSHLGMTGKWVRRAPGEAPLRWESARLDSMRGKSAASVRYLDPRRFGRLTLAQQDIAAWRALGPDPLLDGLDHTTLSDAFRARRRAVKDVLMDQSVIAGLGNIQATEALWLARVDPRARADSLTAGETSAIVEAIATTLTRTLADAAGPEVEYLHEEGASNPFHVYGRAGEPCPRCRAGLTRMVLGGRATTFCLQCQRRAA